MSGFSRHWLSLREAADHRVRADFSAQLNANPSEHRIVLDLGCGTGSNLRYLHARLRGTNAWTCIDNDPDLLAALASFAQAATNDANSVTARARDLSDRIATQIEALFDEDSKKGSLERAGSPARLVTASALLDLVSAPWLDALTDACARLRASVWFALTYDGRISIEPRHDDDTHLVALINAHQLSDKGFGPALGPQAHDFACDALKRVGMRVHESTSDWLLTCGDSLLTGELLTGWLFAAREQCGDPHAMHEWEHARLAQLRAGTLRVRVGHRDLLAVP